MQQALRQMQYILHRICQPLLDPRLHHQTVYDNLNIMLDIFFQLDLFRQLIHASVNPHTDIAALSRLLKQLYMLTLASPHNRSQQLNLAFAPASAMI